MLNYLKHGESFLVIASNSGAPAHPAWYLNLRRNPEAVAQVGTHSVRVRSRVADGEERTRLWRKVVELDPAYAEYQQRTDRQIPVLFLEPVDTQ